MKKLTTTDLCYHLDGKPLIEDISLELTEGHLYAILGPNGSGKSTLLKVLTGIWKPTSGSIDWNGTPLLSLKRQEISRIISLVPQNPLPTFDFLVEDLVAMGRYPYNTRYWDAKDEPICQQALQSVDAWHLRYRKVNQLSFGERQRVYIARALATESPILLLDEPTASLDIRHQFEIWELLEQLLGKNKIIVVTTHDLAIAERYCSNIIAFNHGRCVGQGMFSEIMTAQSLQEIFGITVKTAPQISKLLDNKNQILEKYMSASVRPF